MHVYHTFMCNLFYLYSCNFAHIFLKKLADFCDDEKSQKTLEIIGKNDFLAKKIVFFLINFENF